MRERSSDTRSWSSAENSTPVAVEVLVKCWLYMGRRGMEILSN